MWTILTNKYVIGGIVAIGIVFLVLLYGNSQYNKGYENRDLEAKAEMLELKNKIAQETTEALNRANESARQVQIQQQQQIEALEMETQELERIVKENENAAKRDKDRNRIGLNPSSVLRLNSIR